MIEIPLWFKALYVAVSLPCLLLVVGFLTVNVWIPLCYKGMLNDPKKGEEI